MTPGRIALLGLAVVLALGGVVALADGPTSTDVRPIQADDRDDAALRRDDANDDVLSPVDDDDDKPTGDGDNTRGDDGTNGGNNTGGGGGTDTGGGGGTDTGGDTT